MQLVQHRTVWVADAALEAMIAEARRTHPLETGGMLLGWQNPDRNEAVVVAIVGPGPNADHRRSSFAAHGLWQQAQLDRVYRSTDGKVTYLGDWHVHPAGGFGMSRRDRRTMRATAVSETARCPNPLMALLAGADGDGYNFGIWTWRPSRIPLHAGFAGELETRTWEPSKAEMFWVEQP